MIEILIKESQIRYETEKAYLIKLPRKNLKYWFPKGLTREYKRSILLIVPDEFKFILICAYYHTYATITALKFQEQYYETQLEQDLSDLED